jgi:hypothetical protein
MLLQEGVKEEYRRSSYLHPVYAPGGVILSDDFPVDHPHHRGLFWSWPIVKFDGQTYDVWAVRGMHQRFVRWRSRRLMADRAVLAVENGWFAGERKAVKELVELTAFCAQGGRRRFDVKLTFEAVDSPVEFSGREDKGYGGFGLRFASRTETVLRSERGIEPKDTDHVRHPWAELEAVFAGRRAGARIENDPANPASPPEWCVRHYGYLSPSFPGVAPVTLKRGRPLALRYRVVVYSAQ